MVVSTTFPNPRRFPKRQEAVKSTCRCRYWFRWLKCWAHCHPIVFSSAPPAMLIEVGAVFLTITWTSTAGSRIFKGARCSFGKVASDASGPDASTDRKERATSTSFESIAAPGWKNILRAWFVALHGLVKNVYPIINLHTLSILPWRLLAKRNFVFSLRACLRACHQNITT